MPYGATVLEPVVPTPPRYNVSVLIATVAVTPEFVIIDIVVPIANDVTEFAGIVIVLVEVK